jgi:hypothetical protein
MAATKTVHVNVHVDVDVVVDVVVNVNGCCHPQIAIRREALD